MQRFAQSVASLVMSPQTTGQERMADGQFQRSRFAGLAPLSSWRVASATASSWATAAD